MSAKDQKATLALAQTRKIMAEGTKVKSICSYNRLTNFSESILAPAPMKRKISCTTNSTAHLLEPGKKDIGAGPYSRAVRKNRSWSDLASMNLGRGLALAISLAPYSTK